jgi:hypothetical protein
LVAPLTCLAASWEGGQPWTGTIAYPWYAFGLVQAKTPLAGFSLKETMFVDKLSGMLPFLALGALGVANLVAAIGALRATRRAEELGEGRYELLRDQHERLELLREKRRVLLDELQRLSASRNVSSKPGRTVKVGQCQCQDTMGPWLAYELLDEPVRGCAGFRSYDDVSPRSCLPEAHNSDIAEPGLYESQPHNLVVRLNSRDDRLNACFL